MRSAHRAPASNESYRLTLLAQIVMQMLERLFIAVGLLQQAGQHRIDRRTLESDCITLARRMSRLYGLNAPEFFDARLFRNFIDTLIARGVVQVDSNGHLTYDRGHRRSHARFERGIAGGFSSGCAARPTANANRNLKPATDGARSAVNVEAHAAPDDLPVRWHATGHRGVAV